LLCSSRTAKALQKIFATLQEKNVGYCKTLASASGNKNDNKLGCFEDLNALLLRPLFRADVVGQSHAAFKGCSDVKRFFLPQKSQQNPNFRGNVTKLNNCRFSANIINVIKTFPVCL